MKRIDLIRHLLHNNCNLIREGSRHSVFFNQISNKTSTVPRHKEINSFLAKKICFDLGIKDINKNNGGVAEWSNAPVLKTGVWATGP